MKNFCTGFGQSRTGLRFGLDSETTVLRFCGVFWYHFNSVMNREGKVPYFIWVRDLGNFVCIVGKINNMLLCVKNMLICACVMY